MWIHTDTLYAYLSLFAEIWLYLYFIWAFANYWMNTSRRYIKSYQIYYLQIQLIKTHMNKNKYHKGKLGEVGLFCFLSILKLFIYGNFYFWTKVMNECATKSRWHQPHHYSLGKFLSKCNHCPILKLKIEIIISSPVADPLIGHQWKDNYKCLLKMGLWFRVFAPGDELGVSGGKPSRRMGTGLQSLGWCVWHWVETSQGG